MAGGDNLGDSDSSSSSDNFSSSLPDISKFWEDANPGGQMQRRESMMSALQLWLTLSAS